MSTVPVDNVDQALSSAISRRYDLRSISTVTAFAIIISCSLLLQRSKKKQRNNQNTKKTKQKAASSETSSSSFTPHQEEDDDEVVGVNCYDRNGIPMNPNSHWLLGSLLQFTGDFQLSQYNMFVCRTLFTLQIFKFI